MEHLYKAGLVKPDRAISRDKVSVYHPAPAKQTNNGEQVTHGFNGATKTEPTFDATSSDKIIDEVVNKMTDSFVSANHLEAKPATNTDRDNPKEQSSKELEPKPGEKRKLNGDSVGASPAKRTRASIHSSLQQLLAGKSATSDSNNQSYPADDGAG